MEGERGRSPHPMPPPAAWSESEDEPERAAREVEITASAAAAALEEVGGFERTNVAQVAAHADMRRKEDHDPAAEVPAHLVLVERQRIVERITVGANQSGADHAVRPYAESLLSAEGNPQHQVSHRREHAAAAKVGRAEE